jgi:poly-gamma-glutamate synthesis protein (capsule biosynthesis protein)
MAAPSPLRVAVIATVAVLVAVAAATVVGGDDSRRADPTPTTTAPADDPTTSTRPPATTTTTRGRGNGQPVTFAFGGDVHFEGGIRWRLNSPSAALTAVAPLLADADIAMVNLETAITERGTPASKAYNFRAPASAFGALRSAGVDVTTMANNHGIDYGSVGLADSLAAKATAGIPVLGIGADANEAYAPWRTTVRGQRIAVLAATDVLDDWLITAWTATDAQGGLASAKGTDQARLEAAVRAARRGTDTVVVYLHWGAEGTTCPTPRQRQLADALVAAGADIVVGSHAHRVQGGGRLGSAFVDYGLGNFVFYNEAGESGRTGVLRVTATGREITASAWVPARISGGLPRALGEPGRSADLAEFANRRACAGLGA